MVQNPGVGLGEGVSIGLAGVLGRGVAIGAAGDQGSCGCCPNPPGYPVVVAGRAC